MKVDLNKLEPFDISNPDCQRTISYPSHELQIVTLGETYIVNVDIDVNFDIYTEEDECGNISFTSTNINGVHVLFNEAYNKDGMLHDFSGEEQTNIEDQIKYEILL
jgi:hypothetical protein